MAEKSSFFNSAGGDRKYNASDWAEYFASLVGNGVFGRPEDCLRVVPGDGLTVKVMPGAGWINGYHYVNTAPLVLDLPLPDGVLHRLDRIVLRWSISDRSITAKVKASPAASTPAAPALQRDGSVYELALADVYVKAGAASIVVANITDHRANSMLCGTVSSIVSEAHFHDAASQTKAGFLSPQDKKKLDNLEDNLPQDLSTTANVTFKTVTAERVTGAVYA